MKNKECIPNCRMGYIAVGGEDTAHGALPRLVSLPTGDNLEHTQNKLSFFLWLVFSILWFNSFCQEEIGIRTETIDTVLKKSDLHKENDSLLRWKNDRIFSYMHSLDSLLRQRSGLRADTAQVSAGAKRSRANSSLSSINNLLNSFGMQLFFWLLAIVFIMAIVYNFFIKNGLFIRKRSRIPAGNNEDEIPALKELDEYDVLINNAEKNKEWNNATRYLYLQTIKNISDKELIRFSPEKTNHDYVLEIAGHSLHDDFAEITRDYEYAWYGKVFLPESSYQQLKQNFIVFNKQV